MTKINKEEKEEKSKPYMDEEFELCKHTWTMIDRSVAVPRLIATVEYWQEIAVKAMKESLRRGEEIGILTEENSNLKKALLGSEELYVKKKQREEREEREERKKKFILGGPMI